MSLFAERLFKDHKSLKGKSLSGTYRESGTLRSGIPPFDHAAGGGFAEGRITELFGTESSGKSLIGYQAMSTTQQEGGVAGLLDTEGAYTVNHFITLGGNPTELILPDTNVVSNISDAFDFVRMILDTLVKEAAETGNHRRAMIVWDSIAATPTKHLLDVGMDKRDMSASFDISQGLKLIQSAIKQTKAAFVCLNQTRELINSRDSATHTPGGKALKFHASQRMELAFDGGSRTSLIRVDPKDRESEVIGRWTKLQVVKNRVAAPHGTCRLPIYTLAGYPHPIYGTPTEFGIDINEALFDYYEHGRYFIPGTNERVITSSGAWYQLHQSIAPDEKKFYAKHWPEIVDKYPRLKTLLYEEFQE